MGSMDNSLYYTIPNVRVVEVREYFTERHRAGFGKDATFVKVSLGWFIQIEGSHEALYLGREKPLIETGDRVSITIRKEAINV